MIENSFRDSKYGYANGLYSNYLPEYYFVGEYNNYSNSRVYKWVEEHHQGDFLLLEGLNGMGKFHLVNSIFKTLGLDDDIKVLSGELIIDLIVKKRISLHGGNGCYDEDLYEKTFKPTKYIVIKEFNYLANWFKDCAKAANYGPQAIFNDIANKWIEEGASIILTINEHIDYWESTGLDDSLLKKLVVAQRVCLEMPILRDDKVGIIAKAILKWEFDKEQEKQFKSYVKELWKKAGVEECARIDKVEKSTEEAHTLTLIQMQEVIEGNYNSICEMCATAVNKFRNTN